MTRRRRPAAAVRSRCPASSPAHSSPALPHGRAARPRAARRSRRRPGQPTLLDMTLAMMAQFSMEAERDDYTSFRLRRSTPRQRTATSNPTPRRPRTSSPRRRSSAAASPCPACAAAADSRATSASSKSSAHGLPRLRRRRRPFGRGAPRCRDRHARRSSRGASTPRRPHRRHDGRHLRHRSMTLAAIAPFASSPVTITGIANIHLGEYDSMAGHGGCCARHRLVPGEARVRRHVPVAPSLRVDGAAFRWR